MCQKQVSDHLRVHILIYLHFCEKKHRKIGSYFYWVIKIRSGDVMRTILESKQPARKATKSVLPMHPQYIITRQIFIPYIP